MPSLKYLDADAWHPFCVVDAPLMSYLQSATYPWGWEATCLGRSGIGKHVYGLVEGVWTRLCCTGTVTTTDTWLFFAGYQTTVDDFPETWWDALGNRWAQTPDVPPFAMPGNAAGCWYGRADEGSGLPTVGQDENAGLTVPVYDVMGSGYCYTLLMTATDRPAFYTSAGSDVAVGVEDEDTGTTYLYYNEPDGNPRWNLGLVVGASILRPIPEALSSFYSADHPFGLEWDGPGPYRLGWGTDDWTGHEFFYTPGNFTGGATWYVRHQPIGATGDYWLRTFVWPDSDSP